METARFLQKALGYALSGETALECFFIFYGDKTRNGKSTLSETIAFVMGEYARTIQPQTLSRRPADGGAASPDTARLKGARLVNVPEPEKGLELNIALVKQLTGGTPTHIVDVILPPDTLVRGGLTNPNFGFPGGGIQFDLMANPGYVGSFVNVRPLP
ncbi:MAG: hypothetical protein FWF81_00795 [Defluviitaleaceae bacterium]|nr:hypothetical protein [Defluviitaleaceae bacterium]